MTLGCGAGLRVLLKHRRLLYARVGLCESFLPRMDAYLAFFFMSEKNHGVGKVDLEKKKGFSAASYVAFKLNREIFRLTLSSAPLRDPKGLYVGSFALFGARCTPALTGVQSSWL